jgi:hypothetical protein
MAVSATTQTESTMPSGANLRGSNTAMARMLISQVVQKVGGAMITIALVGVVVNQVLTTQVVQNTSGPLNVVDQLGSTGQAAIGFLILALLVMAARVIMNIMGDGGF